MKKSIFLIFLTAHLLMLLSCKEEIELKEPELAILSESSVSRFRGDTLIISLHINAEAGIQSLLLNDQEISGLNKSLNEQTYEHKYIIEEDHINGTINLVFILKDNVDKEVSKSVIVNIINKDAPRISLADTLNPSYYKFDSLSIKLRIDCLEGLDKISITNENGIEVYGYSSTDNSKLTNINFITEIPFNVVPGTSGMTFNCIAVDVVGQTSSTLTIPVKIIERDVEINFFQSNETEDDIGLQMILEDNLNNLDIYGYGTFSDVGGELIPNTMTSIFICDQDSDDGVVVLYEDYGKPKYFYKYNRQTKVKNNILSELVFLEGDSVYIACYDYDWESHVGIFNSAYIFKYASDDYQLIQTSLTSSDAKGYEIIDSFKNLTDRTNFDSKGPCDILDEFRGDAQEDWSNFAEDVAFAGFSTFISAGITAILISGTTTSTIATVAVVGAGGVGLALIATGAAIYYAANELSDDSKSSVEPNFCSNLRATDKAPVEASISDDNTGFTQTDIDENKLERDPCSDITINISATMDMEGSIMVIASGGTATYQYSVDMNGFQESQVFPNNYSDGLHMVGVHDVMGCSNYIEFSLTRTDLCEDSDLSISAQIDGSSIVILSTGGESSLLYSINNIDYYSNNVFEHLAPGNYTAYVKNEYGCVKSVNIVMNDYCSTLVLSLNITEINILANTIGGTAPYFYSIDGNNYSSNNEFSNLSDGEYTVYVKDSNGCIAIATCKYSSTYIRVTFDDQTYEAFDVSIHSGGGVYTMVGFCQHEAIAANKLSQLSIEIRSLDAFTTGFFPTSHPTHPTVSSSITAYMTKVSWDDCSDMQFADKYSIALNYDGGVRITSINDEVVTGTFSALGEVTAIDMDRNAISWTDNPISGSFRLKNFIQK